MISEQEFYALATLAMLNDQQDDVEGIEQGDITKALDTLAHQLGYQDWVTAYHNMN